MSNCEVQHINAPTSRHNLNPEIQALASYFLQEFDRRIRKAIREEIPAEVKPEYKMDKTKAANYLGIKPSTLSKWITDGKSPTYYKAGGRVYYYKKWLDAYIKENIVTRHGFHKNTAEEVAEFE